MLEEVPLRDCDPCWGSDTPEDLWLVEYPHWDRDTPEGLWPTESLCRGRYTPRDRRLWRIHAGAEEQWGEK